MFWCIQFQYRVYKIIVFHHFYFFSSQNDCICKKGYAGDGYSCDPVNICLEDNGGCHEMVGIVNSEKTVI